MSDTFWKRLNYIVGFIAIGVVFGLTSFLASLEIKDLDLWLHLKMGQYVTEHQTVPATDVLSCTIEGKPWVNHEWLFQVIIYKIWSIAGFNGLIQMQVYVVILTMFILLLIGYNKNRQLIIAFALLLVLGVYESRFTIRPDIFSLLFFSSFIWILSWFINRSWALWALVLIQILWTNMHGFFFFGPALVGIALLSEFLRRHVPLPWEWNQSGKITDEEYLFLKKLFPLLILACCVNPLTFKGAWYPIGVLLGIGQGGSKVFFAHITELQRPIKPDTIWTTVFGPYKAMIVLSAMALLLNRKKIDISSLFIWIIFLLFSLAAIRNLVFFAVAGYLVFMANITTIDWKNVVPFRISQVKFKYLTSILLTGMLIFWMLESGTKIASNGYFDFDNYDRKSEFWGVSLRSFPYHAVDFLVLNKVKGNFYNDFNSGAYLIGRCYPNIKVYIDGRTEVYGSQYFQRYQKIWREGNKKLFLEDAAKYNITGAFLNNNNHVMPPKVLKMFYQMPDWKIVYFDYDAVIFLKDIPANKKWIDRFAVDLKTWPGKPMDLQRLGTKRVDPLPLTHRGQLLKYLGFDDSAIKEGKNALKVSPDDFEAHKLLGEVYEHKGDYRRAFEAFRIGAVLKPYDTDMRLNLAEAYEHLNDYEGAMGQYDRVLEVNPDSIPGNIGLARSLANSGRLQKALELLDKPMKLSAEDKIEVKKIRDTIEKNKKTKTSVKTGVTLQKNKKE